MAQILAYYIIVDNGDGSASVRWFQNKEEAEAADAHEMEEYGMGTLSEGVATLNTDEVPWLDERPV